MSSYQARDAELAANRSIPLKRNYKVGERCTLQPPLPPKRPPWTPLKYIMFVVASRSRSSSSTSSRSRHRHHKKSRRRRRHTSSRSVSRSRSSSPSKRSRSGSRDRHRRRRSRSRTRSRSRDRSSRKHKKSKHKRRKRSSSSDSDRSDRYTKSRSARSSADRGSRGSTRDRDRRERTRERDRDRNRDSERDKDRKRDRERDRDNERDVKVLSPVPEEVTVIKNQEMSESEKLAYTRAVEEIDEGGFVQQNFKSSRDDKTAVAKDGSKEDNGFNFGTQAELSARANKFIPLSDDSLFSPHVEAGGVVTVAPDPVLPGARPRRPLQCRRRGGGLPMTSAGQSPRESRTLNRVRLGEALSAGLRSLTPQSPFLSRTQ
ncbi:hypothetical protein GWK47_029126 [Chionoecetes opilio]|uniref:Uncharacterized protein n=1 Tax=Chionoecetes opilio TaxID=41210 RepID=A0A8J5D5S7_CHIOP|nr:hypothetical protein GWK47_029126 [Chionoecetes opilio]